MSQLDQLPTTSSFSVSEEAVTGCSVCADSLSSQMQQTDEDCVYPDPGVSGESDMRRANKAIKLKDEHLDLRCQWRHCDYRTCLLDHFVLHISLHIPQAERRVKGNKGGKSK
jgi:hypothetical protein